MSYDLKDEPMQASQVSEEFLKEKRSYEIKTMREIIRNLGYSPKSQSPQNEVMDDPTWELRNENEELLKSILGEGPLANAVISSRRKVLNLEQRVAYLGTEVNRLSQLVFALARMYNEEHVD